MKCLQEENRDHLLTLAHLHHKRELVERGLILVGHQLITVEDPDRKNKFPNIIEALCEPSGETITEHLQTYGTIISDHTGHYMTLPEVESGICH